MINECIPDKYVGTVTLEGNWGWSNSTLKSPMKLYPESLWSSSKLPAFVKYEPKICSVGFVRISAYMLGYNEKQDTNEEYEICTSKGIKKINVDLSKYKDGESDWLALGTYFFDGNAKEYVKLNRISTENVTRASTVRFEIMNEAENSKDSVWQYLYMGPAKTPEVYGEIDSLNHFTDLKNCENANIIESLYVLKIFDNNSLFRPNNKLTVCDFTKWLDRIFDTALLLDNVSHLSLDDALSIILKYIQNSNINLEWLKESNDTTSFFENAHFFDKTPFIKDIESALSREQGAVLIYLTYHTFVASKVDKDVWKLTFSDDFDGDKLNTDVWECENKAPAHIQSSRWAKNVSVNNSIMSLITVKEKLPDCPNLDWTTASVWVKPEVFSQCGFWQASIKINKGKGINNAFWMIGDGNEIDIVEAHYKNEVHTNYHFEGVQYSENYSSKFDLSDDFHIYALEWTENEFIYYSDGEEIARKRNINAKQPLYPIFSTAVINWAGNIPDTANGSSMDIEWVRIYDRK